MRASVRTIHLAETKSLQQPDLQKTQGLFTSTSRLRAVILCGQAGARAACMRSAARACQTMKLLSFLSGMEGCMRSCRWTAHWLPAHKRLRMWPVLTSQTPRQVARASLAGGHPGGAHVGAAARCAPAQRACGRGRRWRARARTPRAPPGQGARRPRPTQAPACQPVRPLLDRSVAALAPPCAAPRGGHCLTQTRPADEVLAQDHKTHRSA
jgi:hypothetical protein